MKLEKYNKNKLDLENFKKEFIEEKKRKKGKIFKEILNEKENNYEDQEMNSSDNDSDFDMFASKTKNANKASKIQKIDFDSGDSKQNSSSSDWGDSLEESFENNNSDEDPDFSDSEAAKNKQKKKKNKKPFDLNLKGVFIFYFNN